MVNYFEQLDFAESCNPNYYERVAFLNGVKVSIWQDTCAICPLEWLDNNNIILLSHEYRHTSTLPRGRGLNDVLDSAISFLKPYHYKSRIKELAAAIGLEHAEFKALAKEYKFDFGGNIASAYEDLISDHVRDMFASDKLEAIKALFDISGTLSHLGGYSGYMQGEYVEILCFANSQYLKDRFLYKETPNNKKARAKVLKALEADAKVLSQWAFGDVYGVTIEAPQVDLNECYGGFIGNIDSPSIIEQINETLTTAFDQIAEAQAQAMEAQRPDMYILNKGTL